MAKAASWLIAITALALITQAQAEPPRAALRLYVAGHYQAAAAAAEAQPSSSSMAFAARALMADCLSTPNRATVNVLLDRAEQAAHAALELDAASIEGRLQLALVYGVRARRTNIADAIAHNYAPRGRRLIEEALARDPDNAWAHELLGAWHLEVLRRGGHAGAAAYGARLTVGMTAFERAMALAPQEPMIPLHFAVALIELDPERYGERVRLLLAQAVAIEPRDAFEAHGVERARALADVLERDGPEAAERAARAAFL